MSTNVDRGPRSQADARAHAQAQAQGHSRGPSPVHSSSVDTETDAGLSPRTFRLLALGSVLALTASYVSILQNVTAVVGGTTQLLTLVVLMLAGATLFERTISPRTATITAITVGVLGFVYYLDAAGVGVGVVFSATEQLVSDTVALATGMPLLRMMEAGIWTLGFAPGPVFLSWYFALRRRYVLSVIPGAVALLFLVLTGDAASEVTLLGVLGPVDVTLLGTLGAIATVGFGELERHRGTIMQADVLAVLFAVVIVLSLTVTLVPGGTPGPTILVGSDHDGTLEGSLTAAPDQTAIAGSVDLSPEVRFTVRSEQESNWRVGVYDRFTGDGWIRTGQEQPYDGPIQSPPGETNTVKQTVIVEDRLEVMPMAPQPVDVEGDVRGITELTTHGQFRPSEPLIAGDVYNVESQVIDAEPDELRRAGTVYPEEVRERYLQRPEGTSSAFDERIDEIVADAETPYEKAEAIEDHLRTSKDYSLSIDRPSGNVAEEFLLEMDEGYCVYFATAMTQMLRAEEIPARYVTGYTSGQQTDDNEWTVRGLNAHAWVEVYFPDHGWVEFDPTPSSDRDAVHNERLEDAREDGEPNVDTDDSEDVPITETETEPGNESENGSEDPFPTDPGLGDDNDTETPTDDNGTDPSDPNETPPEEYTPGPGQSPPVGTNPTDPGENGSDSNGTDDEAEDAEGPLSSPENAVLGLAILVGLVAGAHRTGVAAQVSREARVHWHGFRRDPDRDVEHAYRRLELLLAREYRPRRPGETSRRYLSRLEDLEEREVIDSRAHRVGELYEQARYGGGVDREEATEAVDLVDGVAHERLPVLGRLWR